MAFRFSKNKYLNPGRNNPFSITHGRIKDGSLPSVYRSQWSEDAYISDNQNREKVGGDYKLARLPFFVLAVFGSVLLLLVRTAYLQIQQGDYYYQIAEGNRIRIERVEPRRGVIYDQKMRPLVRNKPNFLLYFVPADLPRDEEKAKILEEIAAITGSISQEEMEEKLSAIDLETLDAYQPLFVEDNIPYEKAMLLILKADFWPGVVVSSKANREYLLFGRQIAEDETRPYFSLSHIMGYTGKINSRELEQFGDEYKMIDYIGKMGIEYFWENELKGKSGKKQIEVDAFGKEKKIVSQTEAIDGHNLVLSLDLEQQLKLEELLLKKLSELGLSRAAAVVVDPNNGEVKALVSIPAYNNNVFARGITSAEYEILANHPDKPLFNRAVSGEYPSGSTFKPIMLAAALEEKVVGEYTSILSTGGIGIGQWYFPDWRAGGHGRTDARKAIADSVNTYFYYIGGGYQDFVGLGVDRIVEYGKLFGLNYQTGIDLAGEASGFLPSQEWKEQVKGERWYIGDTYHLSIGQGDLLVTPLQVAVYTSIFANGGNLYRPHFVRQILSAQDHVIKEVAIEPVRENVIDAYNMHIVREAMKQTVENGSARSLSILPVSSAGKTGTAQWSSKNPNHAWYTGFAPFDKPEIAFTILLEEGGEGSTAAVPVAKEYLEWYFGEYKGAAR